MIKMKLLDALILHFDQKVSVTNNIEHELFQRIDKVLERLELMLKFVVFEINSTKQ